MGALPDINWPKVIPWLGALVSTLLVIRYRRWVTRPKVRILVKELGLGSPHIRGKSIDPDLIFEASNFGDRPVALSPVIRLKAKSVPLTRSIWYPGRLVSETTARRWRIYLPIPPRVGRMRRIYDCPVETDLSLKPHAGPREFRALPRDPAGRSLGVLFLFFAFRLEGSRRRKRVRIIGRGAKAVGALHFWLAYLRFRLTGQLPRDLGPTDIDAWRASKRSRD